MVVITQQFCALCKYFSLRLLEQVHTMLKLLIIVYYLVNSCCAIETNLYMTEYYSIDTKNMPGKTL